MAHLDRNAETDEREVGSGQARQERVGHRLHPPVARDRHQDQDVADEADDERQAVHHQRGGQLTPEEDLHRFLWVVVEVAGRVAGLLRARAGDVHQVVRRRDVLHRAVTAQV